MPRLTDEQWAAVRADWCTLDLSFRHLGKKYGVHESAVRDKMRKEQWDKDPAAMARMEAATASAFIRHARRMDQAASETPHPTPQGGENSAPPAEFAGPSTQVTDNPAKPALRTSSVLARYRPEDIPTLSEQELSAVRQAVAQRIADIWEQATLGDLARVDQQASLFARLHELLTDALAPDDGTEEGTKRRGEAIERLIVGRTDSIGGMIQALAKLGNDIQAQRRRAIGLEDRPKQVQVSGPGGAPLPVQAAAAGAAVAVEDLTKLPTDKLQQLWDAAAILAGQQERPPVPMPPGEVVTVDPETGQPEAENET